MDIKTETKKVKTKMRESERQINLVENCVRTLEVTKKGFGKKLMMLGKEEKRKRPGSLLG